MTQDGAKRPARDRAPSFDESHPMTRGRLTEIIENPRVKSNTNRKVLLFTVANA